MGGESKIKGKLSDKENVKTEISEKEVRETEKKKAFDKFESAKAELDGTQHMPTLQILALHDYRQNGKMFNKMVEPFQGIVGSNIHFTYVNAPIIPLAFNAE